MNKLIIIAFAFLLSACTTSDELPLPQEIGSLKLISSKSDTEAVKDINELHGVDVATQKNVIGKYGSDSENFDLLYVSMYSDSIACKNSLDKMIAKMKQAENSPFFHLMAMPEYNNRLYFTIGMGAFHYIYTSGNYLIWLQTYQPMGREIPANLKEIYPVY